MLNHGPYSIVDAVLVLADSAQINVNSHLSLGITLETYLNSLRTFPEIPLSDIVWNAHERECIAINSVYAVTVVINGNQRTAIGPTVDLACSRVASFLCNVIDATSKSTSALNNRRAFERKSKDKFLVSYLKAGGMNMDCLIELELNDASVYNLDVAMARSKES